MGAGLEGVRCGGNGQGQSGEARGGASSEWSRAKCDWTTSEWAGAGRVGGGTRRENLRDKTHSETETERSKKGEAPRETDEIKGMVEGVCPRWGGGCRQVSRLLGWTQGCGPHPGLCL